MSYPVQPPEAAVLQHFDHLGPLRAIDPYWLKKAEAKHVEKTAATAAARNTLLIVYEDAWVRLMDGTYFAPCDQLPAEGMAFERIVIGKDVARMITTEFNGSGYTVVADMTDNVPDQVFLLGFQNNYWTLTHQG